MELKHEAISPEQIQSNFQIASALFKQVKTQSYIDYDETGRCVLILKKSINDCKNYIQRQKTNVLKCTLKVCNIKCEQRSALGNKKQAELIVISSIIVNYCKFINLLIENIKILIELHRNIAEKYPEYALSNYEIRNSIIILLENINQPAELKLILRGKINLTLETIEYDQELCSCLTELVDYLPLESIKIVKMIDLINGVQSLTHNDNGLRAKLERHIVDCVSISYKALYSVSEKYIKDRMLHQLLVLLDEKSTILYENHIYHNNLLFFIYKYSQLYGNTLVEVISDIFSSSNNDSNMVRNTILSEKLNKLHDGNIYIGYQISKSFDKSCDIAKEMYCYCHESIVEKEDGLRISRETYNNLETKIAKGDKNNIYISHLQSSKTMKSELAENNFGDIRININMIVEIIKYNVVNLDCLFDEGIKDKLITPIYCLASIILVKKHLTQNEKDNIDILTNILEKIFDKMSRNTLTERKRYYIDLFVDSRNELNRRLECVSIQEKVLKYSYNKAESNHNILFLHPREIAIQSAHYATLDENHNSLEHQAEALKSAIRTYRLAFEMQESDFNMEIFFLYGNYYVIEAYRSQNSNKFLENINLAFNALLAVRDILVITEQTKETFILKLKLLLHIFKKILLGGYITTSNKIIRECQANIKPLINMIYQTFTQYLCDLKVEQNFKNIKLSKNINSFYREHKNFKQKNNEKTASINLSAS